MYLFLSTRYDFVEVEDLAEKSILGRWCGSQLVPPSQTSKGSQIRIRFVSDEYFPSNPGFCIRYSLLPSVRKWSTVRNADKLEKSGSSSSREWFSMDTRRSLGPPVMVESRSRQPEPDCNFPTFPAVYCFHFCIISGSILHYCSIWTCASFRVLRCCWERGGGDGWFHVCLKVLTLGSFQAPDVRVGIRREMQLLCGKLADWCLGFFIMVQFKSPPSLLQKPIMFHSLHSTDIYCSLLLSVI